MEFEKMSNKELLDTYVRLLYIYEYEGDSESCEAAVSARKEIMRRMEGHVS